MDFQRREIANLLRVRQSKIPLDPPFSKGEEKSLSFRISLNRFLGSTHNMRDFLIATQRFKLLVLTPGQFLRKLTL